MRQKNLLKEKLKKGEPVIGCWNVIPSPTVVNIIGVAGFDYVIIDAEHGPTSYETEENLVRSAVVENMTPLMRVGENNESQILRALETGAHGIVVPHIDTKEAAQKAVDAVKYYPQGNRGLSPFTVSSRYSMEYASTHTFESNENTLVMLLVEGKKGISNLNEISDVEHIDVVYIGTYDLSQSLGIPGQIDHPQVLKHIRESAEMLNNKGISVGCFSKNKEYTKMLLDVGVKLIANRVDCDLIIEKFMDVKKDFVGLL